MKIGFETLILGISSLFFSAIATAAPPPPFAPDCPSGYESIYKMGKIGSGTGTGSTQAAATAAAKADANAKLTANYNHEASVVCIGASGGSTYTLADTEYVNIVCNQAAGMWNCTAQANGDFNCCAIEGPQ